MERQVRQTEPRGQNDLSVDNSQRYNDRFTDVRFVVPSSIPVKQRCSHHPSSSLHSREESGVYLERSSYFLSLRLSYGLIDYNAFF